MPLYLLDKTVEGLQIPKPIMVCSAPLVGPLAQGYREV